MHLSLFCYFLIHFYVKHAFGNCGMTPEGEYGVWNPWDSCDAPCGGGNQSRWRSLCCPTVNGIWSNCSAQYNKTDVFLYEDRHCSETCLNGGSFLRGNGCVCPVRYSGRCCETAIDFCSGSPCKNGASCADHGNGFLCTCASGFKGHTCSAIDYCSSTVCKNGGSCVDQGNGYSCTCAPGFKGDNCSDIDDCVGVTCPFGQACVDKLEDHDCTCITVHLGSVDICIYYLSAIPFCLTIIGVCVGAWLIRRGKRKSIKVLPESAPPTSTTSHNRSLAFV